MKLKAILAAVAPFLATDKKPEDVLAAVIAADKAAKDAAGSGLGARELEEKDAAKDKAAKDAAKVAADKAAKDAKDKAAKDAGKDPDAEDEGDDPEHTNDKDMDADDEVECGDPSTPGGNRSGGKTAIDSAEIDRRIRNAVGARDALHTALKDVEPILGVVTFDSAGKAYRAALDHLKVDTTGVHSSALPAMLRLVKDRAAAPAPAPAMDSAGVTGIEKLIPGYGRLR